MSFRPIYTRLARAKLLSWIHWRVASDVDAAVIAFAETRAATIPGGPIFELRAAGYRVILAVDRHERAVYVLGIYRGS
jgi:hypothetical protein